MAAPEAPEEVAAPEAPEEVAAPEAPEEALPEALADAWLPLSYKVWVFQYCPVKIVWDPDARDFDFDRI